MHLKERLQYVLAVFVSRSNVKKILKNVSFSAVVRGTKRIMLLKSVTKICVHSKVMSIY